MVLRQNTVMKAALLLMILSASTNAQSPPTDLTELGVEEILALHIIRQSAEEEKGKWSVGYHYISAKFDGNRDGTDDFSVGGVLFRPGTEPRTVDNFPVVPLTILQQAHLFAVTYDVTRSWAVGLLVPFIQQETPSMRPSSSLRRAP